VTTCYVTAGVVIRGILHLQPCKGILLPYNSTVMLRYVVPPYHIGSKPGNCSTTQQ
jgi:hypothetical protein